MLKVGLVGWRGMVGSVLMDRMRGENDFAHITPTFFSTSQVGQTAPAEANGVLLGDANDIAALAEMDVVLTCQGGDYTASVHSKLRDTGWSGYWIDAASTLRMKEHAEIVLDPVNRNVIDAALDAGTKDYIGGNCTVSLMMMALGGLFVGIGVAMTSTQGRRLWAFITDARIEIRKVVWPTKQETTQTAIAVFVFTLVMALFFWGLDSILLWITQWAVGTGS